MVRRQHERPSDERGAAHNPPTPPRPPATVTWRACPGSGGAAGRPSSTGSAAGARPKAGRPMENSDAGPCARHQLCPRSRRWRLLWSQRRRNPTGAAAGRAGGVLLPGQFPGIAPSAMGTRKVAAAVALAAAVMGGSIPAEGRRRQRRLPGPAASHCASADGGGRGSGGRRLHWAGTCGGGAGAVPTPRFCLRLPAQRGRLCRLASGGGRWQGLGLRLWWCWRQHR